MPPEIYKRGDAGPAECDGHSTGKKGDQKMGITYARQAVQRAEDARLVTLRKQAAERQRNAELAQQEAEVQAQQSALERGAR